MSRTFVQFARSRTARYGAAAVVVGVAILLRLALLQVVAIKSPFLMLFAAIMVASAFGGLGPGILATVLASIASDLYMTGWPDHWRQFRLIDPAGLGIFFLEGLFLSLLGAMLHRARLRAEASDLATRKLEQRILEISEGERRRIGHDLHDGLGQHLTGIALLVKALRQRMASSNPPDQAQAEKIAELVNQSIGWTRDLARGLSPMAMDPGGLTSALEELATNTSEIAGIKCVCSFSGPEPALGGETSLHLYRIAQEAVNNSIRHGKATLIRLELTAENGQLTMKIIDDGSGVSEKTRRHPGIGLQIMQYRARMIGARLAVDRTAPGLGTTISCTLVAREPDLTLDHEHVTSPQ